MGRSGLEDPRPEDAAPRAADDEVVERAVRALQGGAGSEAFEAVFKRFYRPLFNFFANQPSLRDEADDLTQETLLRAFEKIDQYTYESSFEGWLRRIGENVWKNAVRNRRAARRGGAEQAVPLDRRDGDDDRSWQPVLADEQLPTPEEQALLAERAQVIEEALRKLPAGMRRCTELRLGHDLKYHEIADVMGIGLNSVRSQLFEARKRLRPILDRYFAGAEL